MNLRVVLNFIVTMLLLTGCTRAPALLEFSGPTMGTTYSVKVVDVPRTVSRQLLQHTIDEVLRTIDVQMSAYREDSELSRFNAWQSAGCFDVSPEIVKVVALAAQVSEQSAGALDLTIAPLVNVWGMGPAGERSDLPTADELEEAQAQIGYRKLAVRAAPPGLCKESPQLSLDLNAVAPGYAVDLLAERLAALAVTRFMIDIGGEVRARGRNAQDQLWRIAVERPVDAEPEPYAIVQLDDIAVTTSGEYRHYIERDGQRYSHTIDPRTARPVAHDLASVVVIMPTALEADAWATALNVLGEEEGYRLAQQRGIAAMFIVARGQGFEHRMTAGFERHLAAPLPGEKKS